MTKITEAVETFLAAYRARYRNDGKGGIRSNAPMLAEVTALNSAFIASREAAAPHAPTPDAVQAAVVAAAAEVTEQKFSTYKAKNGRDVGIEDDNGEKCWIVPFDAMHALEAALACYQARSAAPGPTGRDVT